MKSLMCSVVLGLGALSAFGHDGDARGLQEPINASFNYQGKLMVDGQPANGDFYFEVRLLDSNGDEIDPRFSIPGPIAVVDGIFDMDILMGGTDADADFFWRRYGHLAKKARIGVSDIDDGDYTIMSPDVDLGSSPHALYSRYAGAIQFPYVDTYRNIEADPQTMLSLANEFGGTVLELVSGRNENDPILDVRGSTVFGLDFGPLNGAVRIDASDELVGLLSSGGQHAIVGLLEAGAVAADSAIIAQVQNGVLATAIQAVNSESNTFAILASPSRAGDFGGNVRVNGDTDLLGSLAVDDAVDRDFGTDEYSPVGPIAYGFVSSSGAVSNGTANLNCVWDPALSLYRVTVDGVVFSFGQQSAQVAVVDTVEPRVATTNAVGGELRVAIWDLNSGNVLVQDNFQIAIYDPSGGSAITIDQTPPGVDPDKFTEQTGVSPVRVIRQPRAVEPPAEKPEFAPGSAD